MPIIEYTSLGLVILFVVVVLLRLLKTPLRLFLRLAGNTALGFLGVWLVNLTTDMTGFSLGLNWFNALTVGVLGLPGFFALLLTQWVLT